MPPLCLNRDSTNSLCYMNGNTCTNYLMSAWLLGNKDKEGDIRLVGSSDFVDPGRIYGRVEIFLSGVWGTVSDDRTDSLDARVVCRQLGYNTYGNFILRLMNRSS